MSNFNRGSKKGGERSRRSDSFGGDSRREKPKMHQVICSDCGIRCQVPFKPTGERPVYCSECFENHAETGGSKKEFNRKQPIIRKENSSYYQEIKQEQNKHYDTFNNQMSEVIERLDKIIGFLKESKNELALKGAIKTAKEEIKKEKVKKTSEKKVAKKVDSKKTKEGSIKKKKETKKK